MFKNLRKTGKAFTLIELLVVILIIALLIVVAAPSFLGQQTKTQDSQTKQELTVVRKTLKAIWIANEKYPALGAETDAANSAETASIISQLKNSEPGYQYAIWTTGSADTPAKINSLYKNADNISVCQKSLSGKVFCLLVDETGTQTAQTKPKFESQAIAGQTTTYTSGTNEQQTRCRLRETLTNNKDASGAASGCNLGNSIIGWDNNQQTATAASVPASPTASSSLTINSTTLIPSSTINVTASFTGNNITYTYQWKSCDANDTNCVNVGTNQNLYVINTNDIGKRLKVEVSATNEGGTTSLTSNLTNTIQSKYADTITKTNGLMAFYRFDDNTNGQLKAYTVNNTTYGQDGTTNNTPTLNSNSLINSETTNKAMYFDGSLNQGASIPINLNGVAKQSYEFWLQSSFPTAKAIMEYSTDINIYQGFYLFNSESGDSQFSLYSKNTAGLWSRYTRPNTSAHHYVIVIDQTLTDYNEIKMFIDGQLLPPQVNQANNMAATGFSNALAVDNRLYLMRRGASSTQGNTGTMDDLSVYNRALTNTEILEHCQAGKGTSGSTC